MQKIYDFNKCPLSSKNGIYGGAAGDKDGVIFDNSLWMIKYPKNTKSMDKVEISYTNTPLCEYIGSHIYAILGYDVHETELGVRNGKVVVACKDFTDDNTNLLEIRTIKNHKNDELSEILDTQLEETGSNHSVDLDSLLAHIYNNPILINVKNIEKRFFEQAVIDIFINNNDRNNGNWGILRHKDTGEDTLAPIFDNGACLQSKLSIAQVTEKLKNPEKVAENALNVQTSYSRNGKFLFGKQFLKLKEEFPILENTINKVSEKIKEKLPEILEFINSIPEKVEINGKIYDICPKELKELYKSQLKSRAENIFSRENNIINNSPEIKPTDEEYLKINEQVKELITRAPYIFQNKDACYFNVNQILKSINSKARIHTEEASKIFKESREELVTENKIENIYVSKETYNKYLELNQNENITK